MSKRRIKKPEPKHSWVARALQGITLAGVLAFVGWLAINGDKAAENWSKLSNWLRADAPLNGTWTNDTEGVVGEKPVAPDDVIWLTLETTDGEITGYITTQRLCGVQPSPVAQIRGTNNWFRSAGEVYDWINNQEVTFAALRLSLRDKARRLQLTPVGNSPLLPQEVSLWRANVPSDKDTASGICANFADFITKRRAARGREPLDKGAAAAAAANTYPVSVEIIFGEGPAFELLGQVHANAKAKVSVLARYAYDVHTLSSVVWQWSDTTPIVAQKEMLPGQAFKLSLVSSLHRSESPPKILGNDFTVPEGDTRTIYLELSVVVDDQPKFKVRRGLSVRNIRKEYVLDVVDDQVLDKLAR